MMKKGYARGGMKKKMMMAGGASMKKKAYAMGGALKAPTANQKGLKKLPEAVRNKMGYMKDGGAAMYKKGFAAGGAAMKKKMMAGGGATSDYDITQRKYGGAGKKATGTTTTTTTTAKKPVVTKDMMAKAGVTSLRDFYNKMEVNAAGTGYKKRAKALQRVGENKKSSDGKQVKSLQGKSSSQIAKVSARNKNKKETQFERLQRLNKEAMAKTGGKSGRLKSS